MDDFFWMRRALFIANKALLIKEFPVASILVINNFELAYCFNSCYVSNFCHSENNIIVKSAFYFSKCFLNDSNGQFETFLVGLIYTVLFS